MTLVCKLCGQQFTVLPDVLDKELDMREASGLLMHHINHSHAKQIGTDVGQRLQAVMALCGWVFFLQQFAKAGVGWEDQYTKALGSVIETIIKVVKNEPTTQHQIVVPTGQQIPS